MRLWVIAEVPLIVRNFYFLSFSFNDTPCLSKNEMVGPRQYNSVKYIVMLRGRSILFQVATRMRNSLIRDAVRYSIHNKRDPIYHLCTRFICMVTCPYLTSRIYIYIPYVCIFYLRSEIIFAMYKADNYIWSNDLFDKCLLEWNFTHLHIMFVLRQQSLDNFDIMLNVK